MDRLLLEIGAEEIPAGYIKPALHALKTNLLKKMTDARIKHGDAETFGTPRKLVVAVDNVAAKQESCTTEVVGPSESVGFDKSGNPTMATEKFAEKIGVSISELKIQEIKKGRYVCAKKIELGVASHILLSEILPEVILAIPFPKTMKWGALSTLFARPIFSILALLGEHVISFTLGDIKSDRYTQGHSFMHPEKIKISDPKVYIDKLQSAKVLADIEARKAAVETAISEKADSVGGSVLEDPELVDIVTNLIEYPVPVVGKFDTEFLELPDEILITSMREHQKYFAVVDEAGSLLPYFIAVNNTVARDMDLVAMGHGRVIRARLADAQFFYKGDVKVPMDNWVKELKGVLFQARLGTMHAKVNRVKRIAGYLAKKVLENPNIKAQTPDLMATVSRAAILSKTDLVSQVVVEFPKLQGVMGRVYATVAGEPYETAQAIEEHYQPTSSGGRLPETLTGAIVGIADKIDSICGCFSVGLIPTGASDPYALRRQGIGMVKIILDKGFSFSLKKMIATSLSQFELQDGVATGETEGKVYTFLKNRISHLLVEEGFSKDVITAITNVSVDHVPHVWQRVNALEKLKATPDFEPLATAFKRVVNIIKKADLGGLENTNTDLFEDASETALYKTFGNVERAVSVHLANGDFEQALISIASLRDTVDGFFDGVLVMAKDDLVRNNRLSLLNAIAGLFGRIADFSKITT